MNMGRLMRWIPLMLVVVMAVSVASRMRGPAVDADGVDWNAVGSLAVSAEGRTKPLDTFARSALLRMSGRQSLPARGEQPSMTAVQWVMELMAAGDAETQKRAISREVFRIDHPDLRALFGLPESDVHGRRTRYALSELMARLPEMANQVDMAKAVPAKQQDMFQRQVLGLNDRVMLYLAIAQWEAPLAVAPLASGQEWRPLVMTAGPMVGGDASTKAWHSMLESLSAGDGATLTRVAREYGETLRGALPGAARASSNEVVFNRAAPFVNAAAVYVFAAVLALLGLLVTTVSGKSDSAWGGVLRRSGLWMVGLAFLVQTIGLVARVVLQGRPPVTNLYSSAVFIGWACVPLAFMVERMVRVGIGTIVASVIGFSTLIVAHNLGASGDTMEAMQAVLDSNFWLATHVVVVTIGYSATFLAGFLAMAYILLGVFTPALRGDLKKTLPKGIYGVVCFATVMSFFGTVLGGIWADQSWGRFWGWDPKENGAALIVLINLIILHARWGGMIKERGIAVLAVFGNIVTAWSWFGTNMLGVGLHSYGFISSAVFWIVAFDLSMVAVMLVAAVPVRHWRSFREGVLESRVGGAVATA
ncbi:MAG: cytochrome c biogenesis protein CcsA [Phycisphaerales bacterium]|nr:MAG: cytochrome c biogenesis protein CcsA [Phycisphaerales bacterium]